MDDICRTIEKTISLKNGKTIQSHVVENILLFSAGDITDSSKQVKGIVAPVFDRTVIPYGMFKSEKTKDNLLLEEMRFTDKPSLKIAGIKYAELMETTIGILVPTLFNNKKFLCLVCDNMPIPDDYIIMGMDILSERKMYIEP